jgi:uncharacterized surface protein with fasciclin (FAS1) repeats
MSRYIFQKSIAATVGVAIVSTGLFISLSSHAQSGTPGTTTPTPTPATTTPATTTPATTPATTPTTTPVQKPAGGSMGKPDATTTPSDGMSKPAKVPATTAPAGKTIVDIAAKNKSFKTLVAALKAADLVETLSGEGPFTVFAPTDAAFAKLPKGTLTKLLKPENKEQLKKILTYHVASGAVTSKMLKSGQKVATVEGGNVTVKIRGKKVTINNATVIKPDVVASNGVIHAIDTVLMPPSN